MPNASEASFKIDILIISAWKELSLAFADERLSNACIEAFENCVPLLSGFWNGVCLHHSYKKAACLVHHSLCLLFKCQQVKEAVTISLCCFNIIVFTDVVIHNIYQICLFCFVCSIHVQRSHSPASNNYLWGGGGWGDCCWGQWHGGKQQKHPKSAALLPLLLLVCEANMEATSFDCWVLLPCKLI